MILILTLHKQFGKGLPVELGLNSDHIKTERNDFTGFFSGSVGGLTAGQAKTLRCPTIGWNLLFSEVHWQPFTFQYIFGRTAERKVNLNSWMVFTAVNNKLAQLRLMFSSVIWNSIQRKNKPKHCIFNSATAASLQPLCVTLWPTKHNIDVKTKK